MSENGLKLLVTTDIHYGLDYTYQRDTGPHTGEVCTVLGSQGHAVMTRVMRLFHEGKFDLLLDGGDKLSDNKLVYESGNIRRWDYELKVHFAQAGSGKFLDVQGNHCGGVMQYLNHIGQERNCDFPSRYQDINSFRIVLSNAGTRQRPSQGRFMPLDHERWLDEVVGKSPYPVIFLQHVPPDEFDPDAGGKLYELLADTKMVALVIHGHRHEDTRLEFFEQGKIKLPILHVQALLFEEEKGVPGAHVAAIHCLEDEIIITAKSLTAGPDHDKTWRLDRRDLGLVVEDAPSAAPPVIASAAPAIPMAPEPA